MFEEHHAQELVLQLDSNGKFRVPRENFFSVVSALFMFLSPLTVFLVKVLPPSAECYLISCRAFQWVYENGALSQKQICIVQQLMAFFFFVRILGSVFFFKSYLNEYINLYGGHLFYIDTRKRIKSLPRLAVYQTIAMFIIGCVGLSIIYFVIPRVGISRFTLSVIYLPIIGIYFLTEAMLSAVIYSYIYLCNWRPLIRCEAKD
jgi:hypothetical protein